MSLNILLNQENLKILYKENLKIYYLSGYEIWQLHLEKHFKNSPLL